MRRVTNRRVRSSGVGGELNVLLNNAVQGCPAVQEGQRPIVLLLHVVVLVDDLRVDMGDYVDGVLLRGERASRWTFSGATAGSRRATSASKRLSP